MKVFSREILARTCSRPNREPQDEVVSEPDKGRRTGSQMAGV